MIKNMVGMNSSNRREISRIIRGPRKWLDRVQSIQTWQWVESCYGNAAAGSGGGTAGSGVSGKPS